MFRQITPITRNIIIANVLIYLASNFLPWLRLYETFPAYYVGSPHFEFWQIFTHMFMHAPLQSSMGIMHILFNMVTLWSFGPVLEQTLQQQRFSALYFLSGIGAYALNCAWSFFEISQGVDPDIINNIPMVGASGAIFGVVAAFSTLFPDAKLYFMFIPFGIKAKYLLPIIIVVSLYLGFSGQMGGIAHFAHIGGAIIGYLMARSFKNNRFRIN